jgi:outer membrane protein TolC
MRPFASVCLAVSFAAAPLLAAAQTAGTPAPPPTPTAPSYRLSLDEAVQLALQNSPDILVEKYGPQTGLESVRAAEGAYDPLLDGNILRTHSETPGTNRFSGGQTIEATQYQYNARATQLFATGGALRLAFNNTRTSDNNVNSAFEPLYTSGLTLSLNQPLLKNFFSDPARLQLRVAKNNRAISDAQFSQIVVNTVAQVKNLYYELIYNIDNLQAARKSLDLANQLLSENRIRVRVGTLAPLDVVEAQSEVAGREQGVILAEEAVGDAQDALKRVIFPHDNVELWGKDVVPTDRATAEPVTVDVASAIMGALKNRSDVLVARKSLDTANLQERYAHNQTLPQLDFVGSYGSSGTGGTQLLDLTTGAPLPTAIQTGALNSVFKNDFPTWTVGLNFSYPILNHTASANSAIAKLGLEQAQATLRRVELDATIEVRKAARAVDSNYKSVEATRAARVLQEQRLDAEGKRFTAGLSTTFQVNQAQRDLATAQVAEIRAIADYRESLVSFDRVQQASVPGVTVAGSTSTSTTTTTSPGATAPSAPGAPATTPGGTTTTPGSTTPVTPTP